MNIRRATVADLPAVVALCRNFPLEGKLPMPLVPEVWLANWQMFLDKGIGVVIVSETEGTITGAIGGFIHPDINSGEKTLSEAFWYVDPASRGHGLRLLAAFEESAQKLACKRILMIHLLTINAGPLERIYSRRGYTAIETHYVKEL